jgi:hypothetical protein
MSGEVTPLRCKIDLAADEIALATLKIAPFACPRSGPLGTLDMPVCRCKRHGSDERGYVCPAGRGSLLRRFSGRLRQACSSARLH